MKTTSNRKLSEADSLIDSICDHFEDACKKAGTFGVMPSPEAYLEQVPEKLRRRLLRELAKRELDYRQRRLKTARFLKRLSDRLAPLTFTDVIGRGGMGKVYKAHDDRGQLVAVKVLPKEYGRNAELRERFEREAEVLSQIPHENIIALIPIPQPEGESKLAVSWKGREGIAYFVMEYAEGGNLRARIAENGIAAADAVDIILQICAGLQCAHASDIVHRDIKPENILIDCQGRMKIADFGLAKVVDSMQTRTNQGMGTPAYMAPEQQRGASKVDHRADIYSIGVVLYELLTGKRPIIDDLPEGMGQVESWLQGVVLRALAHNPGDRFQHLDEMIDALRAGSATQISAGIEPVSEPSPYVWGAVVECRWRGGSRYYKGRITEIDGERYHISYDDGDKEWTTADLMRLVPAFEIGTVVECRWKGGDRYYPGKITEIDGDRYHISYDDGDKEWTTADTIKKPD